MFKEDWSAFFIEVKNFWSNANLLVVHLAASAVVIVNFTAII